MRINILLFRILLVFALTFVTGIAWPSFALKTENFDLSQINQRLLDIQSELTFIKETNPKSQIINIERILQIEKDIVAAKEAVSSQDKRISDLSLGATQQGNHISLIGIFIGVAGIVLTVVSVFTAAYTFKEAKKKAKEEAEHWIHQNAKVLKSELSKLEENNERVKSLLESSIDKIKEIPEIYSKMMTDITEKRAIIEKNLNAINEFAIVASEKAKKIKDEAENMNNQFLIIIEVTESVETVAHDALNQIKTQIETMSKEADTLFNNEIAKLQNYFKGIEQYKIIIDNGLSELKNMLDIGRGLKPFQ